MADMKSDKAKLIKALQALKNKSDSEGRKLRRALRALGHKGGVRDAVKKSAPKAKPAPKVKKLVPTATAAREAVMSE